MSTTDDFSSSACPPSSPMLGFLATAIALVFSFAGALYGIAQATRDGKIRLFPVLVSASLAIMGFINSLIIAGMVFPPQANHHGYSIYTASAHLAAGLSGGLTALVSGIAIGRIVHVPSLSSIKHNAPTTSMTDEREGLLMMDHYVSSKHDSSYSRFAVSAAGALGLLGFLFACFLTQSMFVCADYP